MKEFLIDNHSLITKLVEVIAALAGSFYLTKSRDHKARLFVWFLWLTFIIELLGGYQILMQRNYDYQWFINLKNSVFCLNTWLYNVYCVFVVVLIGGYYINLLNNHKFKKVIRVLIISFITLVLIYFVFTDFFFVKSLPYNYLLEAIVVFICIIFYFMELIMSDEILKFSKSAHFYIGVSLFLWYLCVTPLFIFDGFLLSVNSEFNEFRYFTLLFLNIFMYSCITYGFIKSVYKRK